MNTNKKPSNESNPKPQTRAPVDRESVRLLSIEIGVREAARRCGLSEDRVRKWSSRYKWLEQKAPKQQQATVTTVTSPGDILLESHQELEQRTKSGLARATMAAAEKAAKEATDNENPLPVNSTSHLRDLAQAAARLFGWDANKQPGRDTYNTLVISPEQIERIRQAADASEIRQTPQLEGP